MTPETVNEFLIENFPSAAATGNRCVAISPGTATARWPYDATQLRPGGYIPGPSQFGLADLALWFAVFSEIGLEAMAVTSHMSINFLRPAMGDDLYAKADLLKVGKSGLVGEIRLWVGDDSQRLVAMATGTYVAPPAAS